MKSTFNGEPVKVFKIETKSQIIWLIKAALLLLRLKLSGSCVYDVVYAYNHSLANVMFACAASKILKKPFVVFVWHIERYQTKNIKEGIRMARSFYRFNLKNTLFVNLIWPIIRIILTHADAIIVPSNATANSLIPSGIQQSRIYVVPPGLEHEVPEYSPIELKKNFDCVYIGRLTPNKGFFDALLTWKLVTSRLPNAKLAIVGGKPSAYVKNLIDKNKLDKNIIFLGFLHNHDLSNALYKSKLLLLPSYTEGFCFTVGKAILHHVPVIAYDIPVLREVYGFLDQVRLVKEGDTKSLSMEIVRVLLNQNSLPKSIEMESSCLKLLKKYSWCKTSILIGDVFRFLVDNRGRSK